jgi:hypothetical protein
MVGNEPVEGVGRASPDDGVPGDRSVALHEAPAVKPLALGQ